jgi:predicted TIM-barrel fold metal-dependent hydrolase
MRDAIDCDVHCAPASMDVLLPYLDDYWRSYIDDATIRLADLAYPPGAATSGPAPSAAYGDLAPLLERVAPRGAVLSCLVLDRVHRNPHYAAAVATAVNDWLRDEWLARDERLRAGLVVSTLDIPAAVKEIERRASDERFVQVLLPVRTDVPYGNRVYHPLYEAAERHGLRIAIHAWGRSGAAPTTTGLTTTYLEDYLSNAHLAELQMISLVAEGVFERFPALGVVFAECGFAWLPPLLWRFDKDWKGVWREVPWVKERPSAYVRRHVRLTTAPAQLPRASEEVAQVLEMVGPEMLLYASDAPHDHGDSGGALLRDLGPDDVEAVLRGNATAFYTRAVA